MALFGRSRRQAWGTDLVFERINDAQGTKVGAIVHDIGATNVLTLAVFPHRGEMTEVSARIECENANPFTWTHSFHMVNGKLYDIGRTDQMPDSCVPLWAEYAVAAYMASHEGHEPMECTMLHELDGELHDARFSWEGNEAVLWQMDGELQARHEVQSSRITMTSWNTIDEDLVSLRVPSEEELLAGIAPTIRYRVIDFVNDTDKH